MLRVELGDRSSRYCDELSRRSFLKVGTLSLGGLALPQLFQHKAAAAKAGRSTSDTAVILIWLDGGPTHMETYDPKPDAPAEYRGPLKPLSTNVPGIQINELMPGHARVMDKLAILRSVCHNNGDHFAA